MNRKVVYTILSVMIFVFLVISGMSAWLLGTSDGASWLIKMISNQTGVEIEFTKIEGRLWDSLGLEGIRVHWRQGYAKAEKLSLEWRPLMILTGSITINKLSVSQAVIQDDRPDENEPPDLSWPQVSGLTVRIDARIDSLEIDGFHYRRLEQAPFRGDALSSLIVWHEGTLSLRNLIVTAPDIAVSGTIEAGFLTPSLRADVFVSPSQPVQDIERFSLKADLSQGQGDEQLQGPLTIKGMAGNRHLASLSGTIGLTKTALALTHLEVQQEKRRGMLKGKGEIDFSSPTPVLHLSLAMEHLDLSPEIKMITDISVTLEVKGNPEAFEGSFTFANKGEQWHQADLAAFFSGGNGKMMLQTIKGSLLGGTLAGRMQVSWTEGISLKSDLRMRNMNPALLSPGWSGVINMNLSAEIKRPDRGDFEAELNGRILESRLRGRELTGGILASMRGESILINTLFLKGKGFAVSAHGDLGKRLSFLADIKDLSGLLPGTEGRFHAEGWVGRKKDAFSGSVNARGNNLMAGQAHIQDVSINAFLSESTGSAVRLKAEMKGVEYEKIRLRKAAVELWGKPESHDIKIQLTSPDSEFHAGLKGGYHKRIWHGKLVHLSYKDTVGWLNLASSADLYASKNKLSLSSLTVKGPRGEELALNGEVTTQPLRGFVHAEWQQLNLARGNRWLEPAAISGHASGNVRVTWDKGSLTGIEMLNAASAVFVADKKTMGIKDAQLQMRWNNNGLDASVFALFAEGGVLQATAASSSPAVLSFPQQGRIDANWKELNLIMLNPFLPENIGLTGKVSGTLKSEWEKRELLSLAGKVYARGTIAMDGHRVYVEETSLNFVMREKKIVTGLNLELTNGGSIKGQFVFPLSRKFALPEQGTLDAHLEDINLALLRSLLPGGLEIRGSLSGEIKGKLMTGGQVEMSGRSFLAKGTVIHRMKKGELSAGVRDAAVSWVWSRNALQGDISLTLTQYGKVEGHFELPVPARLPAAFNKNGAINVSVDADVREKGLLASLFPGLVQESHGTLEVIARVDGTWAKPEFSGSLQLKDAGAFFPSAGITVKDVAVKGHLEKENIVIDIFTAKSGAGNVEGTAAVLLKNWKVQHYKGNITGKRFQTVYLPELQVVTSPELVFEGSPEKLSLRGEMEIPELFVYESETPALLKPSEDVVVVDAVKKPKRKLPFALDIQVHLVLGKKVFVKAEGIDAQLGGDVYISAKDPEQMYGKGLIQVSKGAYRRYGINLAIQRGRLIFSGPVTRPNLDILALRTIGDVKAGVTVAGTPQSPEVKLYSEPPMPDTDILAYMVLGRPLGENRDDSSAVLRAAGILLSQGESAVLQEKMTQAFGIDTLDVESGEGELERSMVTVGKYLTPELFISYGRSLFGEGGLFLLRYRLSKHWEIETQTGEEMGGDIYYKIDFK